MRPLSVGFPAALGRQTPQRRSRLTGVDRRIFFPAPVIRPVSPAPGIITIWPEGRALPVPCVSALPRRGFTCGMDASGLNRKYKVRARPARIVQKPGRDDFKEMTGYVRPQTNPSFREGSQ